MIESYRPGVAERLGIGYETLKARSPGIVYCSTSGYGQDGPRRDNPAYDQIIQGRSGVMSITGDADSTPLRTGHPVCDATGGLTAAFAVAAALHRRAVTGEGQFIDVSMLESMLATMSWAVANHTIAGVAPTPMGNENPTGAPSGAFRTRDGVLNVAANTQAMFDTLCRLIGREDLARDKRFRDRDERKRNRAALNAEIERAFAERDTAEWEEMLNREGIPAGPVLDVPTAIADEQIAARGFRRILSAPPGMDRDIDVLRAGFRLSGGDPAVDTPPPVLGRHTEQILAELGYADVQIRDFASRGVI